MSVNLQQGELTYETNVSCFAASLFQCETYVTERNLIGI